MNEKNKPRDILEEAKNAGEIISGGEGFDAVLKQIMEMKIAESVSRPNPINSLPQAKDALFKPFTKKQDTYSATVQELRSIMMRVSGSNPEKTTASLTKEQRDSVSFLKEFPKLWEALKTENPRLLKEAVGEIIRLSSKDAPVYKSTPKMLVEAIRGLALRGK